MTIEKKLRLAGDLFAFAITLKINQLRIQHPTWSQKQLQQEAIRLMERANR